MTGNLESVGNTVEQTACRIAKLRSRLGELDLDGLLVTDEINVRYLSGFTGDSSALLVTSRDVWILSDRRYEEQIASQCAHLQSRIRGPEKRMQHLFAELASEQKFRRLGFEGHAVSWSFYRTLVDGLQGIELIGTSDLVARLRAIKDAGELQILRRAIHIAERAFRVITASLRPGLSELQVAYAMEQAIRDFGGSGVGFSTIVASGSGAALPHYHPGTVTIEKDIPLLIDWGAKLEGYTSDMTRTLALGKVSERWQEVYQVVLEAHLAAIDQIRPGARLCDIDGAARGVIQRAGYGEYFGHGLGHGIGLQVHEMPRMAAIEQGELQEGMVITVEPGIYLPGELGVRIEDDVLVTAKGHEVLCSLPKGLEENRFIL